MAAYNQFRVTLQTSSGSVQVVISATDASSAAHAAEAMIPGSRATLIVQIG